MIECCLIENKTLVETTQQYAFSLGWKADCRSFSGYTEEDIQKMQFLIEDYQLLSHCKGKGCNIVCTFIFSIAFQYIINCNYFFRCCSSSECKIGIKKSPTI